MASNKDNSNDESSLDDLLDATLDDFKKLQEQNKEDNSPSDSGMKASEWSRDFLRPRPTEPCTPANSFADVSLLQEAMESRARAEAGASGGEPPKPSKGPDELDLAKLLEQLAVEKDDEDNVNVPMPPDSTLQPDLLPMMERMMQSLLSKDLLYPAIKDIVEKYPEWLADNRGKLPKEEFDK